MALYDEGVTSESPTETGSTPAPTDGAPSAGTQNTEPTAPRTESTVPYGRFAEVNHGWRDAERRYAASEQRAQMLERQHQDAQQRLQALEQRLQERVDRPSQTPEEEYQRLAAERALSQLPSFTKVARAAEGVPHMARVLLETQEQNKTYAQQIQDLQQWRTQNIIDTAEDRLRSMTAGTGLNFDQVNAAVTTIIKSHPEVTAAFLAGDRTILPRAFELAKKDLTAQQQALRADLAKTKTSTAALPPRPGGGAPGAAPTLPKFDPANPDAYEKDLFKMARTSLVERLGR